MIATRESYGRALAELGEKYKDIVVLDADLSNATKTIEFKKKFPDRFFNVGIAEQDLMGTAAGFASTGKIPFASTFAIFASGRAYDQVRNSICYSKLNVKIAATHAGITVGEDGASHQALEDIALMRVIPNLMVLSPCDDVETRWMIEEVIKYKGPVYIRLARPATPDVHSSNTKFELGKGVQIGDGTDATIIATGVTVSEAMKAKDILEREEINIRVIDMHTIKPIDKDLILKCARETKKIITVEDHSIIGGLGSSVCEVLSDEYPTKVIRMGINDEFGQSGKWDELMEYYRITGKYIAEKVSK
jgi:transketolase